MRISDWSSDVCSSDLSQFVDLRWISVPDRGRRQSFPYHTGDCLQNRRPDQDNGSARRAMKRNDKTPPVVVITGASAGVGRAVVRAFAADGAKIGLIARGLEGLEIGRAHV